MKYFALQYDVVPDFLARRAPHRPAHLAAVREAHSRGEIVMAGALADPAEALLVFKGLTPETAERFARADPYVAAGLVTRWRVREWTVVVGGE